MYKTGPTLPKQHSMTRSMTLGNKDVIRTSLRLYKIGVTYERVAF